MSSLGRETDALLNLQTGELIEEVFAKTAATVVESLWTKIPKLLHCR
jgi:hypothetical protein